MYTKYAYYTVPFIGKFLSKWKTELLFVCFGAIPGIAQGVLPGSVLRNPLCWAGGSWDDGIEPGLAMCLASTVLGPPVC